MSNRNYREVDILRQLDEMSRIADEAFRGFFADVGGANRHWQPRVDVHETPEAILIKAELAGVKTDGLSVVLSSDDRVLTIAGVRGEEDGDRSGRIRCYQLEISYGPFERQIVLPGDARIDREKIQARSVNGFLTVTLPKLVGVATESRTIPIVEG